jgi:hypothetical protein
VGPNEYDIGCRDFLLQVLSASQFKWNVKLRTSAKRQLKRTMLLSLVYVAIFPGEYNNRKRK